MADLGKAMITPRGIYNETIYYYKYDLVYYNRSSYLAQDDEIVNITPGTDITKWKPFVLGSPTYTLANSNGTTLTITGSDGYSNSINNFISIKSVS